MVLGSLGTSIIIVIILIMANGLFAMTEIAIVTSKKNRLVSAKEKGDSRAAYALKLTEDPNQLLSTIQIGITLIGVITGAFGGATIAGQLAEYVDDIAVLAPISYQFSFFLVVGLSTYLSLIIGELVPKRIGMGNPEKVACRVAKPMYYFSKFGRPLIWFLSKSTELVLKLLRIKPSTEPNVTEEEITSLIEQGVYSGVVEEIEQDMMEQIFDLGDRRLADILTPRTQIVWIDIEDSFVDIISQMNESPHSKFPVGKDSLDDFQGILHTKDVFAKMVSGEDFEIADCIKDTLIHPESMKVFQALKTFQVAGRHEAMVIDEYGGIEGFVTLHDIMENIIGDMPLREEQTDPEIIEKDELSWLADGLVAIDTFRRYFDLEDADMPYTGSYHTLGGFITNHIGDIPKVTERVIVGNLRLEVVDMDHVRVDKVMITKVNREEPEFQI
ncbi:hemolysin family protein [Desulfitobacterium dichloroeliminans]|nr:hemolysin family protein [Desulfitobacterium dichloroeliminans]